jgi:hypothetical protein
MTGSVAACRADSTVPKLSTTISPRLFFCQAGADRGAPELRYRLRSLRGCKGSGSTRRWGRRGRGDIDQLWHSPRTGFVWPKRSGRGFDRPERAVSRFTTPLPRPPRKRAAPEGKLLAGATPCQCDRLQGVAACSCAATDGIERYQIFVPVGINQARRGELPPDRGDPPGSKPLNRARIAEDRLVRR